MKIEIIEKINILTIDKIKNYLKIENDKEDELLLLFLNTAEEYVENFIEGEILQKQFLITGFATGNICVYKNLIAIKEFLLNGIVKTEYSIEKKNDSFNILNINGNYEIKAICGSEKINPMIESGVLKHIAYLYENRNDTIKFEDIQNFYLQLKKIRI